jgi:hypothetical protein
MRYRWLYRKTKKSRHVIGKTNFFRILCGMGMSYTFGTARTYRPQQQSKSYFRDLAQPNLYHQLLILVLCGFTPDIDPHLITRELVQER